MPLIIAIVVGLLVYNLQYRLYSRLWKEKLDIDISFERPYMEQGEHNSIKEVLSNGKSLPLPLIHIKYAISRNLLFEDCENASVTDMYHRNDVFSVMGRQRITRNFRFMAEKRGYYTIENINVIARDIFMTKTFAVNLANCDSGLYVFPRKNNNTEFQLICNWMLGDIETRTSLFEDPFSFGGIREYTPSDSMKRINWKATARTNRLMVNKYNPSSFCRAKILLNLDTNKIIKTPYIQETAIELTSSLAKCFIDINIPVMVESNGYDIVKKSVERVDFGASANHMITIDKYLARIGNCGNFDEFMDIVDRNIRGDHENITYIFVTAYYNEELLIKIDYLARKGISVRMLVLYYDRYGFSSVRDYMRGWEVKLIEG